MNESQISLIDLENEQSVNSKVEMRKIKQQLETFKDPVQISKSESIAVSKDNIEKLKNDTPLKNYKLDQLKIPTKITTNIKVKNPLSQDQKHQQKMKEEKNKGILGNSSIKLQLGSHQEAKIPSPKNVKLHTNPKKPIAKSEIKIEDNIINQLPYLGVSTPLSLKENPHSDLEVQIPKSKVKTMNNLSENIHLSESPLYKSKPKKLFKPSSKQELSNKSIPIPKNLRGKYEKKIKPDSSSSRHGDIQIRANPMTMIAGESIETGERKSYSGEQLVLLNSPIKEKSQFWNNDSKESDSIRFEVI